MYRAYITHSLKLKSTCSWISSSSSSSTLSSNARLCFNLPMTAGCIWRWKSPTESAGFPFSTCDLVMLNHDSTQAFDSLLWSTGNAMQDHNGRMLRYRTRNFLANRGEQYALASPVSSVSMFSMTACNGERESHAYIEYLQEKAAIISI